jgi:hypothetical protein
MKRVLALLAIAGLSAAVGACGDDSGDDDDGVKNDAGNDAGKSDAGRDASTDATGPRGQQIDTASLGDACNANSDCTGAGTVTCLKTLPTVPTVTGGYCTAECNASAECGPNGACPTGDAFSSPLITSRPGAAEGIASFIPKQCFERCTAGDAGGQGSCSRAGYVCASLVTLAPPALQAMFSGLPVAVRTFGDSYCIPGAAPVDAGTSALIVGGLDAGT